MTASHDKMEKFIRAVCFETNARRLKDNDDGQMLFILSPS